MKYTKRLWRFLIIGCMTWSFEANAETEMAALAKVSDLILAKHPQTDKDKDGSISLAELEAAKKVWVKKFPKLDRDGDGVFSKKESLNFLKMVHQKKRGRGSMKEYKLKPDFSNFAYGTEERQVMDVWLADSKKQTPVVFYIHGGGFKAGSKEKLKDEDLQTLIEAGISVVSINYRYRTTHPLPTAHHDAKRALQTVRSKSAEWNIDKQRVGVFGGSAGAQVCMWLAYSDDMAEVDSKDAIARESTRVTCVATTGGQTNRDTEARRKLVESMGGKVPDDNFALMFGQKTEEKGRELAVKHSATYLISADDPPIYMKYFMSPQTPWPSVDSPKFRGFLVHHVSFGLELKKKADEVGAENHLIYPGVESKFNSMTDFLIRKLQE